MRSSFSAFATHTAQRAGQLISALVLSSFLAACQHASPDSAVTRGTHAVPEPETQVIDYQRVECPHIWAVDNATAMTNSLYWLRGMDCAVRLSPARARAEARRWHADEWHSAFKQAVLMSNGNVTPYERRQYMQRLDSFSGAFPASVRPLIQLWRNDQMGLLQLSEERTRYHHLQQTSDAELDALRQQHIALKQELVLTRRKLDTLTDIERQLSSRRSTDATDNNHGERSASPESDAAGANTEATEQP